MGVGDGALASSASDKKKAATYMEEHLLPDTQAAGRMGEGSGAVHPPLVAPAGPLPGLLKPETGLNGLSSWATHKGLSDALTNWQGQAGRLMGTLHGELNALRGTGNLFQGQDLATKTQFSSGGLAQIPFRSRIDQM
ncbi:hypothetical protein [Streptomyces sp. UNOC14_S4]|uniref:hypothetical protein n=1 Tax=Streptomyces sp. UNOC14_S4 TaxID=2872340 RepID=UPI001E547A6D|nr:hypothetical protein [Streptomyces sp. UNOC14_S4]MCC3766651.1 hypothetical protein [Streptomyces sp. UNOC14_S4]